MLPSSRSHSPYDSIRRSVRISAAIALFNAVQWLGLGIVIAWTIHQGDITPGSANRRDALIVLVIFCAWSLVVALISLLSLSLYRSAITALLVCMSMCAGLKLGVVITFLSSGKGYVAIFATVLLLVDLIGYGFVQTVRVALEPDDLTPGGFAVVGPRVVEPLEPDPYLSDSDRSK